MLVALVILATAVVGAAALAADASRAVGRVRARDVAVRRASAFLDAVALWPREDLDRHLGERAEGPWRLRIGRPTPTLYDVTLLAAPDDSAFGGTAGPPSAAVAGATGAVASETPAAATPAAAVVLLTTALYRPAVLRGARP
ncbi:hypothetical protein tb265_50110 [Gemmatimonadetes bacterium T265]|nr:hypothetical protein tb265_50110 [Gemmatimonadetes bacterium T265]